jgi:hypothetical protein
MDQFIGISCGFVSGALLVLMARLFFTRFWDDRKIELALVALAAGIWTTRASVILDGILPWAEFMVLSATGYLTMMSGGATMAALIWHRYPRQWKPIHPSRIVSIAWIAVFTAISLAELQRIVAG